MVQLVRHQSCAAREEDQGKVVFLPVDFDHRPKGLEAARVPSAHAVEEKRPSLDAAPALRVVASEDEVRCPGAEDEDFGGGPEDLRCKLGSLDVEVKLVGRPEWQFERLATGEGVAEVLRAVGISRGKAVTWGTGPYRSGG